MASNALEKSLRTLEAFQTGQNTLTVKEIAEITGDAVSSVQRSTFTLESLGYLEREEGGNRYVLGRSCLRPAYGFLRNNRFLELASPHLIELSERLNTRCDLIVLDGTEIVYLARFPSKDETFDLSPVGRRWPAISTASGRAILAALPKSECDQILENSIFKKVTAKTITDKQKVIQLISEAKQTGVAYQFEEVLIGAASISAAITSADGSVTGAILVGGAVAQFRDPGVYAQLSSSIHQTALSISAYNITGGTNIK